METLRLLTTSEVAERLGITRQAVAQRVRSGSLEAAYKSPEPNGGYLFDPEVIDAARGRYQR